MVDRWPLWCGAARRPFYETGNAPRQVSARRFNVIAGPERNRVQPSWRSRDVERARGRSSNLHGRPHVRARDFVRVAASEKRRHRSRSVRARPCGHATLRGTLQLGTSGVVLPGNKQTFPPLFRDKSRLSYYASIFNSVEINSSFYKIPQSKTLLRWAAEVPGAFQFTVKLWKEITHAKDLKFRVKDIDFFMQTVRLPPGHQGCLLIQFPGKITFKYLQQVSKLLKEIK